MTALSSGQAAIVAHSKDFEPSYIPIESPTNIRKSDLPPWLLGVEVDWMWDYDNWPHITYITTKDATSWDPEVYDYDPKTRCYQSYALDGLRASFHYHGPCTWQNVDKFIGYQKDAEDKNIWAKPVYIGERKLTTQLSQGYGGRGFEILLRTVEHPEGETATLRGPWHGVPLPGWQEPTFRVKGSVSGTFGVYTSDELMLKAFAYFLPHLRLAHGYYYRGQNHSILTPYVDGMVPKNFPGGPSRRTFMYPPQKRTISHG